MKITCKLILLQASNQTYNYSTRLFTQPHNYVIIKRRVRLRVQATNARNYNKKKQYIMLHGIVIRPAS